MAEKLQDISLTSLTRHLQRDHPEGPTRYHAIPRFVVDCPKLQPRSFPYNLPIGPLRPHSGISRPPALGLGCIRGLEDEIKKEKVGKDSIILPPIQEQSREGKVELDFREATYQEGVQIEHEKDADLVRYRSVRQEPEPEIWQKVACHWDQFQTRPNQFHQYECDRLLPITSTSISRLGKIQQPGVVNRSESKPAKTFKTGARQESKLSFTRPTPGYGGYISRYPVEPRPPQGNWDEEFVNFSKLTYRLYPSHEYVRQEFAHKGPLSRLVTTTHPSNPFNKVDKWNSRPKKLWRRANHSKFI